MIRHATPHPLAVGAAVLALLSATACGTSPASPTVDGQRIVPIDPSRPGDSLFQEGLAHYQRADREQAAGLAARTTGDGAAAAGAFAAAVTDYALALETFDRLLGDATLCPAPSIRCDNAAYLAGRSRYEAGMLQGDLAALRGDGALLVDSERSLTDARSRLDAMLSAFPASSFVASAAYFDGRAHYEIARKFGVGSYAGAELLFERSFASDPNGTWSDNALYYDGRCEFELGHALVAAGTAGLTLADYDRSRLLFDQAIGAESALLSRFATSTYRDNASYYLGRAWLEKPTPDVAPGAPVGTPDAERISNLGRAVTALTSVVNTPSSSLGPGARYWRGRAHYNLWFHQAGAVVGAELDLAVADFHAVPAASTWRDNALYYAVKSSVHAGNVAGACADFADLATNFASSTYTSRAAGVLSAAAITCP